MNIKDINLLQAVCYLRIIEKYAGKKQAAQKFGVSTDTLNKYIENLEHELGYKVLSCNGRGSFLTPRGKELLQKAEIIENVLDVIKSHAENKADISGEVRVGMSSILGTPFFSKDILSFCEQYPNICLKHILWPEEQTTDVKISDVDIGITTVHPGGGDLVIISAHKVEFGYFASPQYISRCGYPQNMEDLINNHHVINKQGYEKYIKGWAELIKKTKFNNFTTNTGYYLYEILKNGLGVGIMPLRFKHEGMVHLEHLPCESNLSLYLVAHKSTKDIPKIRSVISYYKNLLAEM